MTERRPAYDDSERERIRRLLLRYKDDHGVGVPTLQLRIAEAIGDANPDRVPLKSLQRFIAATHRTDDALVDHCMNFLMSVAPPPAEEGLASALRAFLGADLTEGDDCAHLAGRYHGRFLTAEADRFAEDGKFAYANLTLTDRGQGYLEAEEAEFNFGRDPHPLYQRPDAFPASFAEHERHLYRGIALPYVSGFSRQQTYVLMLRNYLHARWYILRPAPVQAARLEGDALEPPLYTSLMAESPEGKSYPLPVWERTFRVEFTRVNEEESEEEAVSRS